jgi:hypothetical protein
VAEIPAGIEMIEWGVATKLCWLLHPERKGRIWLWHEIVQQPVKPFRQKSANVLEMPDFIGCLQFFAF